ncbi:hypothetical protein BpHYR1_006144 [Brachionus plicatilis]|uniref:Uncharacterized protein n=1 Tax=Brachionus plicatilis TaxID=10195 RepID=A0A3M7RVW9_BRAPC|nr:hypothetical protein BpHYR1_006144 [Brachionus plicatilis]
MRTICFLYVVYIENPQRIFPSSVGRRPSLAGPNAAKIRRPGRRSKIWTAKLAGKIKDGRPNVRPNLKRTVLHLAVRLCFERPTQRSKFLTAGLAAKVAVRLYNRPSRRSCSRFKKFLAASMAVCTVPNTIS